MSKESVSQPEKLETNAPEVVMPAIEKKGAAVVEIEPPEPKTQVATAAAVAKNAVKPKTVKKAMAEKPVMTPKAPAKAAKKEVAATKEKIAVEPKAEKPSKVKKQAPKKPKLVRDSFTIPESDYALFEALKERALAASIDVKKSEILRAALISLAKLGDAELINAIGRVERIKTGRPKK